MKYVTLKKGRERSVQLRHPWIFSGAILNIPGNVSDGDVVDVCDADTNWLCRGYLNRNSQITVRVLTWDEREEINREFFHRRIVRAVEQRSAFTGDNTNVCRLINSEGDYLPGLIVDRYGDCLVVAFGTLGMEEWKEEIVKLLVDVTGCSVVVERSEGRKEEGLDDSSGILFGSTPSTPVRCVENRLTFLVDLLSGQKTGFFIDQRESRMRVAKYCGDKTVLNVFSYTGGFSMYALQAGAAAVTNVDSSKLKTCLFSIKRPKHY